MYDYMKALQKRFDRQEHGELDAQIDYAQVELRRDMDATECKKLLRLLDAQNTLLVKSKLMSFTAGFKLAAGIAGELGAPYPITNPNCVEGMEVAVLGFHCHELWKRERALEILNPRFFGFDMDCVFLQD